MAGSEPAYALARALGPNPRNPAAESLAPIKVLTLVGAKRIETLRSVAGLS